MRPRSKRVWIAVHFWTNTLGKGMDLLITQLWFKLYNYYFSIKMALASNNQWRLICHLTNRTKEWLNIPPPLRGRGKTPPPPSKYPGCDSKFDSEVLVMLELWGMRSTPTLPLLPVPLWPWMVVPDRTLSMR